MAKKPKEFIATGSEIYPGSLPEEESLGLRVSRSNVDWKKYELPSAFDELPSALADGYG